MLNQTEPACLVIADITGYTSYLAGVELDHAQDILADLMNTVVTSLRPTFRLAKLEGDAAFTTSARPRSATATPASGCPPSTSSSWPTTGPSFASGWPAARSWSGAP